MAQQYAFWRNPKGKAHRANDEQFAPTAILRELGKGATDSGKGSISWQGLLAFHLEPVLRSALVIEDPSRRELNAEDSWSILRPAIIAAVKKNGGGQAARPQDVLKEANVRAAEYYRRPVERFYLVTSLSVESLPRMQASACGCEMRPLRSTKHYKQSEAMAAHLKDSHLSQLSAAAEGYQAVRVKTHGRTAHEAAESALTAVNVIRGLWMLLTSRGSQSIHFGPPSPMAVGVIRPGPFHTLYRPGGIPIEDHYWWERDWVAVSKLFEPPAPWNKVEHERRRATRSIHRLPYRTEMEDLVARYAAALDYADHDVSLLQLWALLEHVTDTGNASYDTTIQRATWSLRDHELAKEILETLRARRNQYVHSADPGKQVLRLVYLLKTLVEPHLVRLINNRFEVSSISEYASYLSLPRNVSELQRRRQRLSRAIRMVTSQGK